MINKEMFENLYEVIDLIEKYKDQKLFDKVDRFKIYDDQNLYVLSDRAKDIEELQFLKDVYILEWISYDYYNFSFLIEKDGELEDLLDYHSYVESFKYHCIFE